MTVDAITWPQKTQEVQNRIFESSRWNGFKSRDDDIIIARLGPWRHGRTLTKLPHAIPVDGGVFQTERLPSEAFTAAR